MDDARRMPRGCGEAQAERGEALVLWRYSHCQTMTT
jgi:hypothetical protein